MRVFRSAGLACVVGLVGVASSLAAVRHVNVSNAAPAPPYTNWSMAATALQPAVDAAASGDEILVAPGTYLLSGSAVYAPSEKTLTLRSTHSRAAVIDAGGLSRGLHILGSNSVVEGFTVRNGVSGSYGGGVSLGYGCVLRDCLVTSNRAFNAGGVMVNGELTGARVESCTISSNQATTGSGGGIVLYFNSGGQVRDCDILDNTANTYGGGVWIDQGGSVSNCVIMGNRALLNEGGGVYMHNSGTTNYGVLVNSVVAHNSAATSGGGIWSYGPNGALAQIVNCTIVSNTAGTDGGGVFAYTTRMINDIIYFNSAPTNANLNSHDSVLSCIISNVCTTKDYGWPCLTNAPSFVDAGARDFRLATASYCIDAGTTNGAPKTDIEGNPRPRIGTPGMGDTKCDLGAYEYGFHLNEIRFTGADTVQLIWDVQDRGIYRLDAATNGLGVPDWKDVAAYTNPGMPAGQFNVRTQTVAIPSPVPAHAGFRLRISHTAF
jgi:parallel beta-helix repeat protein